tara:strand:+ start:1912 stop:2835 length:924 start_codon:yes stop_codon:yes gene_type:complete
MRTALAVLLTSLLLVPFVSGATTQVDWDEARTSTDSNGGTIGGISLPLYGNSSSVSSEVSELPTVIEVYTATWCLNCVKTEGYMEEAIGESEVELIHYHDHWFQVNDPFGSNSTEERWEAMYGHAVTEVGGAPHLAPTTIIDGERMHFGTRPKTDSITEDFRASISEGSSAPITGHLGMSVSIPENPDQGIEITWNTSGVTYNCEGECHALSLIPWIMFVEETAYYPDGSNGLEHYSHVLRESIQLEGEDGIVSLTPPSNWDGDDMTVVLIVDWEQETPNDGSPLPAAGISALLCSLAALVPRRTNE